MTLLGISGVDWNRVGQPMNSAETLKARLEACGFVDVRDDAYKVHYRSIFIFREAGVILT